MSPHSDLPQTVGKTLPVPALQDTLDHLFAAVNAVVDDSTAAQTRIAMDNFQAGQGSQLQQLLDDFAKAKEAEGTSWLAEKWLEDYVATRTPLPLTSNVGFQLNLPTPHRQSQRRVATLLAAIADLHLHQARGTQPQEIDGRGNHMSPWQWECFNGGIRHPAAGKDQIRRSTRGPESREIGVLIRDRLYALSVSDAAGHVRSVAELEADLQRIMDRAQNADLPEQSFVAPSYQENEEVAGFLNAVLLHSKNAMTYHRLVDFLCVVHVTDPAAEDLDEQAQALHACAFMPNHAWTLKPITYELGLTTEWACLHVEHSTVDGATLVTAISRIQQRVEELVQSDELVQSGDTSEGAAAESEAPIDELCWTEPPRVDGGAYESQAQRMKVQIVRAVRPSSTSMKLSADAASQLVLSIAQQLTYGRIRAVYEAVDMREYVDGRTECLRAVTPEAVAFAHALVAGDSVAESQPKLQAALDAHRSWVKRCKTGNGFDRHFWALRFLADRHGIDAQEFFEDPGIVAARSDFLSTTSIGSADQIVRYTFAPTLSHGFGVNYTPRAEELEFCVSYWGDRAEEPAAFVKNLSRAAEMLAEFLTRIDAEVTGG